MEYSRPSRMDLYMLPHDDPFRVYRVRHKTCRAVVETHDDELWIHFIARDDKGDFKEFMDVLTEEVDHTRIRFINVGDNNGTVQQMIEEIAPEDARSIHEAVNGFTEEEVSVGHRVADSLVGDWNS